MDPPVQHPTDPDDALSSPIPKKKRPSLPVPEVSRPPPPVVSAAAAPVTTSPATVSTTTTTTTTSATATANSWDAPIPRKKPPVPTNTVQAQAKATPDTHFPKAHPPHPRASTPLASHETHRNSHAATATATSTDNASSTASASATTGGQQDSTTARRKKRRYIQVLSEHPQIVLKIQLKGVPLTEGISSHHYHSSTPSDPQYHQYQQQSNQQRVVRQARKAAVIYQEANETDSDDLLTDTDDEDGGTSKKRKKKRRRLVHASVETLGNVVVPLGTPVDTAAMATTTLPLAALGIPAINAPPEGALSTLWYSREVFLHAFVLEKIMGWKVRPVARLVQAEDGVTPYHIEVAEAQRWQVKALQTPALRNDIAQRMAVSRIAPAQCATILALSARKEQQQAQLEGRPPRFVLQQQTNNTAEREPEEVLLVKWRGRSHMHCSWERSVDIQRVDASNNTAKMKAKRYYQAQEKDYGPAWRTILKEVAATAGTESVDALTTSNGEEYFPMQCLEIERILACDESEMNMTVMQVQRAKNALAEVDTEVWRTKPNRYEALVDHLVAAPEVNETWDPEDNVRYVVKWKGLPYADMTWEYWRDIKRDAVNFTEDFWERQKPPGVEELRNAILKAHPHIREFRKVQESPAYGVSHKPRLEATLPGQPTPSPPPEEEESTSEAFVLRSYQLEGVNWLLFNWWNKRSCILADEMGLGKTIQSAAFLLQLQTNPSTKIRGPFLIVAPLSLVGQWQSELATWAPDMNVLLYHGSADARNFLVEQEFYYNDPFVQKSTASKLKKQRVTKFHVLITTYEVALKDAAVLSKIKWRVLIVDEAHRLKNHKSRLFDELASVPRDYCILLTGTPIANATEELFSLLHFSDPHVFSDRDEFMEKFGEMTDAKQVNELHSLLRPYLLRRVKEDVEKSLPPKEETILEVSLTPVQKAYYKAIYERNTAFLFKGAKPSNAPSLMNVMMELRKCCNHPFLVRGAEERILNDAATKVKEKTGETTPNIHQVFADQLVKSSGKMVLMEKLLQKLFDGGHKVLIFSQMVRVLDLLEELLKIKRYRYERLDGSTSSTARLSAVDRFKRKSCQRFVMLLSTRAGGLGLNLTAADIVIIFDSDWNPQNDLQAMARAHRIGQQRSVKIYRFLTAKTYEMHMFHSASLKLGLERAVLSQNRDQADDGDDSKSKKKSDREAQAKAIDELLKKGAYDVFRDEDDKEAEKFMESDIDQLLENSSKKVTYGASNSSAGNGLGSFSKASFVADTGSGEKDVDLDDPDFWSKAVGLDAPVEIPEEVAAMIDDGVKRSRKQVQVYDPFADTREAEQLKKDRIAMEKMLEKEDKERAKMEKKMKKDAVKEKRKRERDDIKTNVAEKKAAVASVVRVVKEEKKKVFVIEAKPKKSKKSDRQRALRRAENENPVLEQLRQAWEVPHRNKATAAMLRFGVSRFCKIRSEANLSSLPLQDVEVFARAFVYQVALQAGVNLLHVMRSSSLKDLRTHLPQWLGDLSESETNWVAGSIISCLEQHAEVESGRRFLRIPVILCEPTYVSDLRNGGALRALRRLGVLMRLNSFVEKCLDSVLSALGHEELGKRGCASSDLSLLDADLKARYVTTEELSLAISASFKRIQSTPPANWWGRSCDVALIAGTFVHGLGNYKAMRADPELPFSERIRKHTSLSGSAAHDTFVAATNAARKVFDDALEAGRIKAELEVQAAVAAAAKMASKREEDAAKLRGGGDGVESVIRHYDTQVENAFEFDGTDSHFVTLGRLHSGVRGTLAKLDESSPTPDTPSGDTNEENTGRGRSHELLSMPDARLLDHRLLDLLAGIETTDEQMTQRGHDAETRQLGETRVLYEFRRDILSRFHGKRLKYFLREYAGIGLAGSQCGTTHRSLNDGTDFGYGSASPALWQVAYGTDAPRYLRALGVPMNISRFAVSALAYADKNCVSQLLSLEKQRFYGKDKVKDEVIDEGASTPEGASPCTVNNDVASAGDTLESTSHGVTAADDSSEVKGKTNEKSSCSVSKSPQELLDPSLLVPAVFRNDSKLRAGICLAVLVSGFPAPSSGLNHVSSDILELVGHEQDTPIPIFDEARFREVVMSYCGDLPLPNSLSISEYIESSLLPHCLRLCLYGNGPATREARGSQGEYETALGVSLHLAPSQDSPCPLPDPCVVLQDHSLEALGTANAILRRTRLLRTCQYLCSSGKTTAAEITEASRSKLMNSVNTMPVWWCPWVHDVALLVRAATNGLLSLLHHRADDSVFSINAIGNFLRSTLENQSVALARHTSSPELLEEWIRFEAGKFPTLLQIERRLAFLCSKATAEAPDPGNRFVVLPMFDHGGWPRD